MPCLKCEKQKYYFMSQIMGKARTPGLHLSSLLLFDYYFLAPMWQTVIHHLARKFTCLQVHDSIGKSFTLLLECEEMQHPNWPTVVPCDHPSGNLCSTIPRLKLYIYFYGHNANSLWWPAPPELHGWTEEGKGNMETRGRNSVHIKITNIYYPNNVQNPQS